MLRLNYNYKRHNEFILNVIGLRTWRINLQQHKGEYAYEKKETTDDI